MFFKAKLPKGSKNGFKTISCRRYPVIFFSKNYFRHQKSSKNWTFCWFLNFYGNIYGLTSFKKNNCRTFRIRWNITKMIKFFICIFKFLNIRCLTPRKCYCTYNSKKTPDFQKKMTHMKKWINFQHFGNISIVSERSEIKLVKTGLIYALILT